jgi:hypothetical protein
MTEINNKMTINVISVTILTIFDIFFLKGLVLHINKASKKLQTVRRGRTNNG